MEPIKEEQTILTTSVCIDPTKKDAFADWQARLNSSIIAIPYFVSLEITTPSPQESFWLIVQRFQTASALRLWRSSQEYIALMEALQAFTGDSGVAIRNMTSSAADAKSAVAEVFITRVCPDKILAYRNWTAKIHQIEAKFPGFRGVHVQSPGPGQENWVTLLQFDTPEHLDSWLTSEERKEALKESAELISAFENHRVISPYSGWFAPFLKEAGELPSAWKQAMIVLLVLFPIVMLEFKFLSPYTSHLNPALGTFVGNAISVALLTWPLVPLAIVGLKWWLLPTGVHARYKGVVGTLVVLLLYLLEIAIFWHASSR